jgi:excisionase family DNA binding protein
MNAPDTTTTSIAMSVELSEELLEAIAQRAADLVGERVGRQHAASQSPYLTIREAADYARCKRQRIDDLLSMRRLGRYKDGSRTLILRAELDAYLAKEATPAANSGDWNSGPSRASVGQMGNRGKGQAR